MDTSLQSLLEQERRIVWTLRSCARRERGFDPDERRLTDPERRAWRAFAGRLHDGDYVAALVENNAERHPLALRPLLATPTAEQGTALLDAALGNERHLLIAATATFLEAAARAFGRPPLDAARVAPFDAIRAAEQRILEFPSTAGRVTASRAQAGAALETYVGYIVESDDDAFLIGLAMLEFDRNMMPTLLRRADLEGRTLSGVGTFTRGVTLGGETHLAALLPEAVLAPERLVTL